MRLVILVLLVLGAWPSARAQSTAAGATTVGEGFEAILERLLTRPAEVGKEPRVVGFVVDVTPDLVRSSFLAVFEEVCGRCVDGDPELRIGLARVDGAENELVRPTRDRAALLATLRGWFEQPEGGLANVYDDVRRMAALLGAHRGRRDVVLVSLENGDAEDDVEGTLGALGTCTFSAIAREAYLADSYWAARPWERVRGCTLRGGDSPFVELPWGFLFQSVPANEATPSGFAPYGLSRLAAATGGRVFLHAGEPGEHLCSILHGCPFCQGDHVVPDEAYRRGSLEPFAPSALARPEAAREASDDPWFQATQRAWKAAERAGIVASRPALRGTGSTYQEERNPLGNLADLMSTVSFSRHARKAADLAERSAAIRRDLDAAIAAVDPKRKPTRYKANADLTSVLLHLTEVNLWSFAAWCRDVAPAMIGEERLALVPPELPWFSADHVAVGIGYVNIPLCHGVEPLKELELPGGEAFHAKLDELARSVGPFLERYANTPYAVAVRRSGLACFRPTFIGRNVKPDRRRPKSITAVDPSTVTGRPARPQRGGSSTPGTGPTSGGRGGAP